MRVVYGYRAFKFNSKEIKGPYFIVANHTSMMDPILLHLSFSSPVYFVATHNLFESKFWGPILKYLFSPIPKTKGVSDMTAVKEMINTVKEGGNVCVFPTGNTTFSGDEEDIPLGLGRLTKLLKVTLVIVNLHGLYGVDPRWGRKKRKGVSYGTVSKVMTYEEYKDIPNEELDQLIIDNLKVEATNDPFIIPRYKSKFKAEYLERMMYVCPDCHSINSFISENDVVKCNKCGYTLKYEEDLSFTLLSGRTRIKNTKHFYDFQNSFIKKLSFKDLVKYLPIVAHHEEFRLLAKLKPMKVLVKDATITLDKDSLTIKDINGKDIYKYALDEIIEMAIQGRNKIIFYTKDQDFELKGHPRRNALAFLNFFYALKSKRVN
jgi:1-acyl-sn-glycerol-3-phosphate acyltransferase